MVRKPSPEKREQFLQAALKLFAEKGVQNTSTAVIAKEAGTAAGTLFLYFPTKQDLINQLALNIGKEQSDFIKAILDSDLSSRETFLTIWEGSLRWFFEHREAYKYYQQVRNSKLVDESVIQESNQYFDYFYIAIQKGFTEGALKPYPFELIGEMLFESIVAVMNLIDAQPDSTKHEEYIRSGFEIFWNGIKI